MNAQGYHATLEEAIEEHFDELQNRYFQHDGATAHTVQNTLRYLEQIDK